MPRAFSFPAEYREYAEGEYANIVEKIRQDIWRRSQGLPPKIPDFAIHREAIGITLVMFDVPPDPAEPEPVRATFADRSQALRRTA